MSEAAWLSQSRETWRETLFEPVLSLSKGLSKPSFPPFSVSIRPLRGLLNQRKALLSTDFENALKDTPG